VVQALDGPAAARPLREEEERLQRALAEEQQTPDAQRGLAVALARLGDVVQALDGAAAARSLREETVALMRSYTTVNTRAKFELVHCLKLLLKTLTEIGDVEQSEAVKAEIEQLSD
jgi:uncharacterized membrane protein YccC